MGVQGILNPVAKFVVITHKARECNQDKLEGY